MNAARRSPSSATRRRTASSTSAVGSTGGTAPGGRRERRRRRRTAHVGRAGEVGADVGAHGVAVPAPLSHPPSGEQGDVVGRLPVVAERAHRRPRARHPRLRCRSISPSGASSRHCTMYPRRGALGSRQPRKSWASQSTDASPAGIVMVATWLREQLAMERRMVGSVSGLMSPVVLSPVAGSGPRLRPAPILRSRSTRFRPWIGVEPPAGGCGAAGAGIGRLQGPRHGRSDEDSCWLMVYVAPRCGPRPRAGVVRRCGDDGDGGPGHGWLLLVALSLAMVVLVAHRESQHGYPARDVAPRPRPRRAVATG